MTQRSEPASILILASASAFRAEILRNAGLVIDTAPARIDERAVEAPLLEGGLDAADIAAVLAEAKAAEVAARHPGRLVLGADQTLSFEGRLLHKPADMDEARRRLLAFSGKTHSLHSAMALTRDGETLWRHVATAHMHVRRLSPGFVGRHLARVGEAALASVGAYRIEGEGIQLFERVDGDHFTIIGLPLLPLLAQLRAMAAIDG
ncbi:MULTISPECIES: Maf-like protein [unclassified Roseitalea]|uniref:Maf-like protein n=1 Tax=unclassified Roseitalea TaxID=2639107 RepID=UPI00273D0C2E|nr:MULTISPECIES: Maf-like protein [unclassified Roseitalea]